MKNVILMVALLLGVAATGCTRHQIAIEHEIKPIHITLDINLKIDRELDDFFGDIDEAADTAPKI